MQVYEAIALLLTHYLQVRLHCVFHPQTAQALDALVSNGISPEEIGLFPMDHSDDCVYELMPSCSEDSENLTPPAEREGMSLFGDLFGGMFG